MKIYTSRPNDSISTVTAAFKLSKADFLSNNALSDPRRLSPGLSLLIADEKPSFCGNIELGADFPESFPADVLSPLMPALSYCCPIHLNISESGELSSPNPSAKVSALRQHGVIPLLGISNLTSSGAYSGASMHLLLNSEDKRSAVIKKAVSCIYDCSCLGIYLEICCLFPSDIDEYLLFIEELSAALKKEGFYFIIALFESESCAELCTVINRCCHRVLIPAYDFAHILSPPGPVCDIKELKKRISALCTCICPEKLMPAVSDYALDWKLPWAAGTRAGILSNACAKDLAIAVSAHVEYDENSSASSFKYTDSLGRKHIIYFEDILSLREKLSLVESFGLSGLYIKRPSNRNKPFLLFSSSQYGFKKYI